MKLHKRVLAEVATLLIKVKAHRGDTLKEEGDMKVELGRLKEPRDRTRQIERYSNGPKPRQQQGSVYHQDIGVDKHGADFTNRFPTRI
jgi:hypothetical protein